MLELEGVEVDHISADNCGVLRYDEVEGYIKPNTRAFVINHASNITGNINDIGFFAELAKKHGLMLIVDGAQTAGAIPVNVSDMDVYCFTGHKSLMGPQGTGGLYVRPGLKIRPLKSGGSGFHSFDRLHPDKMPDALEAGTLNAHGIAGLKAAAEHISDIGIEKIAAHEAELAAEFYEGIRKIENVRIYGDFSTKNRVPVVSLNIGELDSGYVSDLLYTGYDIATRPGAHCAPLMHKALGTAETGAVRFSFGINNSTKDIEKAILAVREIAGR
jgi:selenocysteine lyase/cysteine desulfurase